MKIDENKEEKGEDENIPKVTIKGSEIMKTFRSKEDIQFCVGKKVYII